jgi:acid phosphatase
VSRAVVGRILAALLLAGALAGAGPAPAAAPAVPRLRHVVVLVLENKEYGQVIGSPDAPNLNRLAGAGALLTNYDAVAHPSLPNYLALVSGSTQRISSDCTDCVVRARNLADTLDAAGLTWRTYAEGLPAPGFTGASAGRYAKKHDPLLYFADVSGRPDRRSRVVPLTRLAVDLGRGGLPSFSLVVPDLCHDMHDCSVATGDAWVGRFLSSLLASRPLRDGAVFVVFDEGTSDAGGGGHVAALVLGPGVRPGARAGAALDHYSLLRTVEDALGLPALGRSARARPIAGIWR